MQRVKNLSTGIFCALWMLFFVSGMALPVYSAEPAQQFSDPQEATTWAWLLERAGRKEHVEKDNQGRVKWVGFFDEEKKRGDYYSGSLEINAEGHATKLTFNAAHFSNDDLQRLAALKHLRILTAWHNGWVKSSDKSPYSGAGLKHLKELPLEAVNFGGSWFNDEGMQAANELPYLLELQAYHTQITDAGIKALANNRNLKRLIIGPQYSQRLTENCLADIATIRQLEELAFNETLLSWEGGLKHLVVRKDQLKKFKIENGFVSEEDLKRLTSELPNTKIEYTAAKPEHLKQMQDAEKRRAKQ